MRLKEIIMVGSENHTKHVNALCVQNVFFFYVKPGGTDGYHWASMGWSMKLPAFTDRTRY